jgi:uncharacterized protein
LTVVRRPPYNRASGVSAAAKQSTRERHLRQTGGVETPTGPGGGLFSYFTPAGLLIGLATGFLSGLMGVGGGIIAVPAMVTFLHVTQHRAHGTSLAMMVLTASASAMAYFSRGQVDVPLAITLSVGTVVGAYIGARIMPRVPAHQLRLIFGVFILLVGIRMIFS